MKNQRKFLKHFVTSFMVFILSLPVLADEDQQSILRKNKQTVTAFYDAVINQKDFDAASRYLGNRYVQHNPTAADGAEGLKQFIHFLATQYPQAHSQIIRIFADGDYVILHVHSVRVPGTSGRAIVDIFKLEHGKIVEHWDVVQDIPQQSANSNGMF